MGLSKSGAIRLVYKHPLYVRHLIDKKIRFKRRFDWIQRNIDRDDEVPSPLVYKFMLNLKCNLRCKMCMLWGDTGWCKDKPNQGIDEEMDWKMAEGIINQVSHDRPSFILSGGEPLLYSHFEDLANLLYKKRRFAIICTNGLLLHKFKDIISKNPYLTFLISLDGLEEQNDLLRGKGVYKNVTENIKLLTSLKHPPYIGIQFTFRTENVHIMYSFCKEMLKLKVDWILFNPCWFISQKQAKEYEELMLKDFNVSPKTHLGYLSPYSLDKEKFVKQLKMIKSERWPMQISCYLDRPEDIYPYIDKPHIPTGNRFCYKQWVRIDIMPSGDISPCIQFPDISFGNVKKINILDIWNSEPYADFRKRIRKCPLPICSKCDAVYLYDAKRRYL